MDQRGLNWEIWAIVFGALVFIILVAAWCSCYQQRRKRLHRQRLEAMMINYRESDESNNTRLSTYSRSKSSPNTPKRNAHRTASTKRSSSVRIPPLSALPEHDILDIETARHVEETNKRLSLAPSLGIVGGVEDFRKKERRSQSTHSFTLEMIQEFDDRLSTYGKDVEDSIEM